ncbi:MAG: T9SS type A sorting domain-containing protein [Bacteroidetes bacterium]|nr:MAG: T9SS type A sorting domain-containing protein [Bacteroidota bacterium]
MKKNLLLLTALALGLSSKAQVVTTVVGSPGTAGFNILTETVANAQLTSPFGVLVDPQGRIWWTEADPSHRIRVYDPSTGSVYHRSGNALDPMNGQSMGYVNQSGNQSKFDEPNGIAMNGSGTFFIADFNNHVIRNLSSFNGYGSTQAASTFVGPPPPAGFGDLVDATGSAARFDHPTDVCIDASGNIYVADNYNEVIRKITPGGTVTTLAGLKGNAGDVDGTGTAAQFNNITAIAIYDANHIVVADSWNNKVRKVHTTTGVVTTVAGLGTNAGFGHEDGNISVAKFRYPTGIAVDNNGNIYVSEGWDGQSNVIRKISGTTVSTIAGKYQDATAHQDGNDTASRFYKPWHMTFNNTGNILYVADRGNHVIRAIDFTPVADFFASPTSTNVNVTVKLTDQSNGATSWSWAISPNSNFNYVNGTNANSENPELQFTQTGSYSVTLTATNAYGNNVKTRNGYINISAISTNDPPVAEFVASKTNGTVGDIINFTDQSTNTPSSWTWTIVPSSHSYVNGTDNKSQNPNVQFTAVGVYTVILQAGNTNGTDSEAKANYINIGPLGVQQLNLSDVVSLYPNPSTGSFRIQSLAPIANLNVVVYDAQGKAVRTLSGSSQDAMEISGLESGVYHVRLSDGTASFSQKLIVR